MQKNPIVLVLSQFSEMYIDKSKVGSMKYCAKQQQNRMII